MRQEDKNMESIVSELKEALTAHNVFEQADIKEAFSDLEEKVNKRSIFIKQIRNLFFLMIIFILITLAYTISLIDKSEALMVRVENLEYRDSLFNRFMEPDTATHTFTYRVREGEPVIYKELLSENDSIKKKYNDAKNREREYKIKLDLVKKNYPITFSEKDNYIKIHSNKIDSALMLLEYYRHKLSYDKDRQVWTILLDTNKEND